MVAEGLEMQIPIRISSQTRRVGISLPNPSQCIVILMDNGFEILQEVEKNKTKTQACLRVIGSVNNVGIEKAKGVGSIEADKKETTIASLFLNSTTKFV